MKEINRILAIYNQLDHAQHKVVLATVVYVDGSAYRRPYIGVLGPRKRYEKMISQWDRTGQSFFPSALTRVHSPIGLDLGAETPDEIALSIMSEIKAFFCQRTGGFLTDRPGPIHERVFIEEEKFVD